MRATGHYRSDKGLILATERDLDILTYNAHHYVCRYDHYKDLLSSQPGGPMKDPDGYLADSTVHDQINRWRRAGWIVYERTLVSEPGYGWVTRKGLRLVGLDDLYDGKAPAGIRYHHYWCVSDVRLHWWEKEEENEECDWYPERRLRAEAMNVKKEPTHDPKIRITGQSVIPDAVVSGEGWTSAIEVQLSPLKPAEMQKKLEKLCRATYWLVLKEKEFIYNYINFYVPSEDMKRHIERAQAHLDEDDQKRITIVVDTDYALKKPRAQ